MSTQQIQEGPEITSPDEADVCRWLAAGSEVFPGIFKTQDVCGGRARAGRGRISVWGLVESQRMGCSDEKILDSIPSLSAASLKSAWAYARAFPEEIEHDIFENSEPEIEREDND